MFLATGIVRYEESESAISPEGGGRVWSDLEKAFHTGVNSVAKPGLLDGGHSNSSVATRFDPPESADPKDYPPPSDAHFLDSTHLRPQTCSHNGHKSTSTCRRCTNQLWPLISQLRRTVGRRDPR